jgi:hypothetical protein
MYTVLSRLLLLVVAVVLYAGASAPPDPLSAPVRLVEIVGPRTLHVGAVAHFRARVTEQSARPVNYLWDLGDGTLSMGALVSYAYATPGPYTISVVARNAAGRDTLTVPVSVEVAPARVDSVETASDGEVGAAVGAPSTGEVKTIEVPRRPRVTVPRRALYGGGGLVSETGGYTWVVATDLWPERARDRMLRYRLLGFRADIYVDSAGKGSPAHRIVLGQFATRTEALAARPWLPNDGVRPWLLEWSAPPKAPAAKQ